MDSSALIKRYHNEKGTNQVDILFDTLTTRKPRCMVTSIWSIPETIATLNRKKNEGKIDLDRFKELLANFFHEIDMLEIIPVYPEEIEPVTVQELIKNCAF